MSVEERVEQENALFFIVRLHSHQGTETAGWFHLETQCGGKYFWACYLGGLDCTEKLWVLMCQRWQILRPVGCLNLPECVCASADLGAGCTIVFTMSFFLSFARCFESSVAVDKLVVFYFVYIWVCPLFLHRSQHLKRPSLQHVLQGQTTCLWFSLSLGNLEQRSSRGVP